MEINKISPENSIVLDFFRGISAQLVVVGHLLSFFYIQAEYNLPVIQNFGVLVFFVLSGFLISNTTFLKGEKYGFKNYVIDRFSRIFYSFVPALLLIVVIDFFIIQQGNYNEKFNYSLSSFIYNLFMFQGYPFLGAEAFGSGRPFWTVSVEWWLYITFGFLYYVCYIKNKTNFFWILLFMISLPLAFFYIENRGAGLSILWFFGFLLAVIYNQIKVNINYIFFILIVLVCLLGVIYRTVDHRNMYDLGIGFFFTILIFTLFNVPKKIKEYLLHPVFSRFSKILASYSYSLYLIHYSLIELYLSFFKDKSALNFIFIFILVNVFSYLFYMFFEKNNNKLRVFLKQKLN